MGVGNMSASVGMRGCSCDSSVCNALSHSNLRIKSAGTKCPRGGGGYSALKLQAQPHRLAQKRSPSGSQLLLRRSRFGHNCATTIGHAGVPLRSSPPIARPRHRRMRTISPGPPEAPRSRPPACPRWRDRRACDSRNRLPIAYRGVISGRPLRGGVQCMELAARRTRAPASWTLSRRERQHPESESTATSPGLAAQPAR